MMPPLPDRVVLLGLLATIGLCFALVFWQVKLNPSRETPLQWRDQSVPPLTSRTMTASPSPSVPAGPGP
jgi:hypothetical protein